MMAKRWQMQLSRAFLDHYRDVIFGRTLAREAPGLGLANSLSLAKTDGA
jgi:hypothetical protein